MRSAIPLMAFGLLAGCAGGEQSLAMRSSVPVRAIGDTVLVDTLPLPPPEPGGAPLAPNDVLDVQVFGVSELNRTVQVDEAGQISLALIGPVQASGRSLRELERAVGAAYGRDYLQSPQVSVALRESSARRVTVDGAVQRAGIYPTSAASTLLQAIAQAGGLSPVADARKVLVFRRVETRRYVAVHDVAAIRRGAAPDIPIRGGDVVVVPDSAAKLAREDLKDILGLAGNVGTLAALGL